MKKVLKIIAILILAATVYSLVPVAGLYLQKDPAPYSNAQAVEKLKYNKGELFEFIVLGDTHSGLILDDSATLKLIRNINREGRFRKAPVDFAVISGDLTFRGGAWDYRIYNRIRSLFRMPVISAIGNHDEDHGIDLFKRYVGEGELSFANRNSYFIVVDNISGSMTDEQFYAFEEELKKSAAFAHRFVIAHKPPISPYFQSWYRPEVSPWSYRFMKLCEKYKVDMAFAGHEHIFNEKYLGGVRYITSGGGGLPTQIPASGGAFPHYTVVRVHGDYVDYEVRKIFPPLWEFFTFYMWKDAFYFLKDVLS